MAPSLASYIPSQTPWLHNPNSTDGLKIYTHFNVKNIWLNNLLVINIWYTQKAMVATHVEAERLFKVPIIILHCSILLHSSVYYKSYYYSLKCNYSST
jgi:hypothetical protein